MKKVLHPGPKGAFLGSPCFKPPKQKKMLSKNGKKFSPKGNFFLFPVFYPDIDTGIAVFLIWHGFCI